MVEHAYVQRNGRVGETQFGINKDNLVSGLRCLADAIRTGGSVSGIQITHAGSKTTRAVISERPVAPSDVVDRRSGETPRTLTMDEIGALVDAFSESINLLQHFS